MKNNHHIRLQAAFTIASAALLACVTPAMAAGSTIPVPANSGTVEGTAALIKAPPKLGAGPFTLGMPADEAVAKMKADGMFNGGITNPSVGFEFKQLPGHPLIGGAIGGRSVSSGGESVTLGFTMYPNQPVVSGILRGLSFTPAAAPSVSNTLAALRKKYGPESGMTLANGLYWLFDYQGHPLSKGQMAELRKAKCLAGGVGSIGPSALKISEGYDKGQNRLACYNTVRVDADIQISDPSKSSGPPITVSNAAEWARAASDRVDQLQVTIMNTPLDYSASMVTRTTVLNGGAALAQEKRDEVKKHKGPSL
jgi:hypothetical protein